MRRGALAVSGSALALTAAILPAQAATAPSAQPASPSWREQIAVPIKGELANFSGIDAVKETDGWAVGEEATATETKVVPLIEHWTGAHWGRIGLTPQVRKAWSSSATVYDVVAASSPTSVWAFGQLPDFNKGFGYDVYLRYNGKEWTTGRLPGTTISKGQKVQVTAAAAISRSDVWVFGGKVRLINGKAYWAPWSEHFNGRHWVVKDVPGLGEISAISAVSYKDIWAVTGTSQLAGSLIPDRFVPAKVLHWTGRRWLVAETQPKHLPVHAILTAVMADTGNHVWVAGAAPTSKAGTTAKQFADHLSGSSWQPAPTPLAKGASVSTCQPESIVPDDQGGLWVLGVCLVQSRSQLWYFNGTSWSAASSPNFGGKKALPLQLATVPGTDSIFAVGAVEHGTSIDALIGIDGPSLG
jgi:hypothetical protein